MNQIDSELNRAAATELLSVAGRNTGATPDESGESRKASKGQAGVAPRPLDSARSMTWRETIQAWLNLMKDHITMTPVKSSQIHAYGYDPQAQTLAVQFHSRGKGVNETEGKGNKPGAIYHYSDFTPKDWKEFQAAESKYSHFHKAIKPAFKHTKVE